MGLLLLCDWESFFLREVRDLPLSAWEGGSIPLHVAPGLARAKRMVTAQQGMSEDVNRGAQAYQSNYAPTAATSAAPIDAPAAAAAACSESPSAAPAAAPRDRNLHSLKV